MINKKVNPENFAKAISQYLDNYVEDIQDEVEEVTDVISKEAKQRLIATSPRSGIARSTKYYAGWTIKIGAKTKHKNFRYTKVIWNKTNYQLTHLLEFGHHKRNGTGWVKAQPHIRQVEDEFGIKFSDLLSKKIGGIK